MPKKIKNKQGKGNKVYNSHMLIAERNGLQDRILKINQAIEILS